jgi:general bacterial porin, GBP family
MQNFVRRMSALAPLALLAGGVSAQQSSLTISGRLDMSVGHQRLSGGPNATFVTSDTSYISFQGVENLGGGMSSYFKLEHGMNMDTGAPTSATQFFNRESFVGLRSTSVGALQLGSQFTPGLWLGARIDPFRRQGTGALQTLLGRGGAAGAWGFGAQYNNSIQYITPTYAGFVGKFLYGMKEGVLEKAPWAVSLEYAAPKLIAGISYDREGTTRASANLPPGAGVVTASATQIGAVYDFQTFKLHGLYIRATAKGSSSMTGGLVGVTVPIMPFEFLATAVVRNMEDAANSDASLVSAQLRYHFSKRTFVYLSAARQKNDGSARFGIYPSRVDGAVSGFVPAAGQDVQGYQIGIRHYF